MWQKSVRYLDHNAGAPLSDSVRKQFLDFVSNEKISLGNPSSVHRAGQSMRRHLQNARKSIAVSLSAAPDELYLNSSGTEGNQTVIRSFCESGSGVLLLNTDHPASYDLLEHLKSNHPSLLLETLKVNPQGQLDLEDLSVHLQRACDQGLKRILLSFAWVNHETGVIQDLESIRKCVRSFQAQSQLEIHIHLDAAQAWGKIEINTQVLHVEWITLSGHKIGAPSGSGVIWTRHPHLLKPLILGSQENTLRGGTENVWGILAMGFAAKAIHVDSFQQHARALRDRFELELKKRLPVRIWGEETQRVSNTSRLSISGFNRYEEWVELLDVRGFAVSHGSACESQVVQPSRVLLNMGANEQEALNSIRVSVGHENSLEDLLECVDAIELLYHNKRQTKMQTQDSKETGDVKQ